MQPSPTGAPFTRSFFETFNYTQPRAAPRDAQAPLTPDDVTSIAARAAAKGHTHILEDRGWCPAELEYALSCAYLTVLKKDNTEAADRLRAAGIPLRVQCPMLLIIKRASRRSIQWCLAQESMEIHPEDYVTLAEVATRARRPRLLPLFERA